MLGNQASRAGGRVYKVVAVGEACRRATPRWHERRGPTLRWLFQCFEGIDLHHTRHPDGTRSTEVLRLASVHWLVLHLLGPAYEICYLVFQETAK
jgi:hypothetical protein